MSAAKSQYAQRVAAPVPGTPATESAVETLHRKRRSRKRLNWLLALGLLVLAAFVLQYFSIPKVNLIKPRSVDATETLAVAGVVEGKIETTVAPEVQGTVAKLFVRENQVVQKGDLLAKIRNRIAETQVAQAEAALTTALAEQAQLLAGTQNSELAGARARTRQALAGLEQARVMVRRAEISGRQVGAGLAEREASVRQAQASVRQSAARQELASKNLIRVEELFAQGAVPKARLDDSTAAHEVAVSDVNYSEQLLASALASVEAAKAGVQAVAQDVTASRRAVEAAMSVFEQAKASEATLRLQPRPEARKVASARVRQASTALESARETMKTTEVRAPFTGTVTEILTEEGAAVTAGVLNMVQSSRMQVRLDVDEGNIADLRQGQRAVVSVPTLSNREIQARVDRISSHVDPLRGTVEVTVVPQSAATWLRSGQTVDVNVILRERVSRITVPVSAVRKSGDKTIIFVVKDGRAAAREVTTGLTSSGQVPLLSGIGQDETIIEDPSNLEDGARVRSQE